MLTSEQQKKVAQHLNTRTQRPKCPVCGATTMRVQPDLLEMSASDPPNESAPAEASPNPTPTAEEPSSGEDATPSTKTVHFVNVTCTYCAFAMLFDPTVIGIEV